MFEWLFGGQTEARSIENPAVPLSSPEALASVFGLSGSSFAGEDVTEEKALGVPAICAAVNLISGTIASLPLHLYSGAEETSKKKATNDPLYTILHDRANAEETSYALRKRLVMRLLLSGRAICFIERNKAGRVQNLWLLETEKVKVRRSVGRRIYNRDAPSRGTSGSGGVVGGGGGGIRNPNVRMN